MKIAEKQIHTMWGISTALNYRPAFHFSLNPKLKSHRMTISARQTITRNDKNQERKRFEK
jgi:hypothetical protein